MIDIHKYLIEQFDISEDTSATIIITVFIFVLGILLQRIIKAYEDYLRRKKIRALFKRLINRLYNQLRKQSLVYQSNSHEFQFKNERGFKIKKGTIQSGYILKELGFEKCHDAFFNGIENQFTCSLSKRIKSFEKIWEILFTSQEWFEYSYGQYNHFIDKYNEYNEKRNDAAGKHRKLIDEIIHQGRTVGFPEDEVEYIYKIDRTTVSWQSLKNPTRPDIQNASLVKPLIEINKEYSDKALSKLMLDNLIDMDFFFNGQEEIVCLLKEESINDYHLFRGYSKLLLKALQILD